MADIEAQLREVDGYTPSASVSVARLADHEWRLAKDLCQHFEVPVGSLIRRAEAIRLAGGQDTVTNCLREAAQHLVAR